MSTTLNSRALARLQSRLDGLSPDAAPRWGRMTPHQALCHLADALRFALGKRPGSPVDFPFPAFLVRVLALYTPLPWPKGAPTLPEFDQERDGTPPGDFDRDREELKGLLDRLAHHPGPWPRHPVMGRMSRRQWGRWAYRHTDHHLRQFGA